MRAHAKYGQGILVGVVSVSAEGSKNVWVQSHEGYAQCPLSGSRRRPLLGGF